MAYYVYLIQAGDTNLCKIGITNNVEHRVSSLQTGNPEKLTVVALMLCRTKYQASRAERSFHSRFKPYRIYGEWFDLDENLISELTWWFEFVSKVFKEEKKEKKEIKRTALQRRNPLPQRGRENRSIYDIACDWLYSHPEHRDKSTTWLEENARPQDRKISRSTWSRVKNG